jgi:hypothetical protein
MTNPGLDAVGAIGTLRIEFLFRADRYGHTISVVEPGGRQVPLLESIEGTAADEWPPSPPLQNLSIEEIAPGRRATLLVGMAGRSHWSASIEPVVGEAAMIFDIACRTRESQASLRSTYHDIATGARRALLTAELACTIQSDPSHASIVVPEGTGGPGTIRWKYRVAVARA